MAGIGVMRLRITLVSTLVPSVGRISLSLRGEVRSGGWQDSRRKLENVRKEDQVVKGIEVD